MTEPSTTVVAAFDLDGTLTEGGSVFHWLRFVAGNRRTYAAALRLLVPLTIGAIRSGSAADQAKERLFQALLSGRDHQEVTARSRDFILEHLAAQARAKVTTRLQWHLANGDDVVIVSASPELYVRVVAEHFGASGALGTRLATDPLGRLSGGYLGRNCRGTEKMRRLDEWISARAYPHEPLVYAYGNSRGDQRMLSRATYGYNVGRLGRFGALRQFMALDPETVTTDESKG